jgi:hypothetical protein
MIEAEFVASPITTTVSQLSVEYTGGVEVFPANPNIQNQILQTFTNIIVTTFDPEQPAVIVPPTHKIEGKVFNYQGIPVARKVCVFSKTTDQFLGSMMSDSVTGNYSIQIDSADPCYIVCLPNESEDINAKIFDRIIPVAI